MIPKDLPIPKDSPLDSAAAALYSATMADALPKQSSIPNGKGKDQAIQRRPHADECKVVMFPQMWKGAKAGEASSEPDQDQTTCAYTTVVFGPAGDACVYFAGKFAYRVNQPNEAFDKDLSQFNLAPASDVRKYYKE